MTGEDPTEDMIRREIAEAARILREDGFHVRRHIMEALAAKAPETEPAPTEGDPPPPKPKPAPPVRKSLWWGDRA